MTFQHFFILCHQWPEAFNPRQAPWVPNKAGDSRGVSSEVSGGEGGGWRGENERNWLPEVRGDIADIPVREKENTFIFPTVGDLR